VLGIGEGVRRAAGGQAVWWVCPSFQSAAFQSGWRLVEFFASKLPGAQVHLQKRMLILPGGGWLQFKTAEEPDSLRGEAVDLVIVDEAAHISALQTIFELCLRPCLLDRKGGAWFISTPKGHNYFFELFQRGKNDGTTWASFQFPSTANPYLDEAELAEIGHDMPALVRRQEVEAEFVQLAGALFKRDAVRVLETEPAVLNWVRSWDLSFTTKTTSDFTVGGRIGMTTDGTVVVADIVRGRWEWPAAVRTIAETAKTDGVAVPQGIETVGSQVAALQTLLADPLLAGLAFKPITVHTDKVTRALPVVARCEQGKLAVVRASWNQEFLDELSAFPEGKHDDQVDSLSAAMMMLSQSSGWTAALFEEVKQANPHLFRQNNQGELDLDAARAARERTKAPFRVPGPGQHIGAPNLSRTAANLFVPRRWKR